MDNSFTSKCRENLRPIRARETKKKKVSAHSISVLFANYFHCEPDREVSSTAITANVSNNYICNWYLSTNLLNYCKIGSFLYLFECEVNS